MPVSFASVVLDKPEAISQCHRMTKRTTTKSRPKKEKDPYLHALDEAWPTIMLAYDNFKQHKPIVEYRIREKKVYAYPALPYIDDLTDRTREEARQVYLRAVAAGQFMIFVRDTSKRVFKSYVFPVEEPDGGPSEIMVS